MRKISFAAAAWALLALCTPAFAHGGHEHHDLPWIADPWALALLVAGAIVYLLGWMRLAREDGALRALGTVRLWSFIAGMLVLAAAPGPPPARCIKRMRS
jgi:hypothetical protein